MVGMAPTNAGDLIEKLMALKTLDEWIACIHPDAQYQPVPNAPVYEGLTQIREWAEKELADPRRPQPLPVSLIEVADKAVIRGQIKFARGPDDKPHHVVEAAAWVVTVREEKLRRVEAFSSWSAAEEAAGIAARPDAPSRRLGTGFHFLRDMTRPRHLALRYSR
jgi:hypothetical protein